MGAARPDLRRSFLYGILDLGYVSEPQIEQVATEMVRGGVDLLQLRGKDKAADELRRMALRVLPITRAKSVPLIINDHPEIAAEIGSEGVHVGQDDVSVSDARRAIGPNGLVGKSTHSLEQAIAAAAEGADYIGFGPLFATATKPDYAPIGLREIAEVHARVALPIFCIGGIRLENLADVVRAGARRVVIVSALLTAPDVADYARTARMMLARSSEN